jgi:CTP synthase (UTP-ammonia lyase)
MVPHVTNRIIDWIREVAHIPITHSTESTPRLADVCLVEVCCGMLCYQWKNVLSK